MALELVPQGQASELMICPIFCYHFAAAIILLYQYCLYLHGIAAACHYVEGASLLVLSSCAAVAVVCGFGVKWIQYLS